MNENILIVEDDPVQRHMLENLIKRKMGYDCLQAENGRIALDVLNSRAGKFIRLIVLDLQMPIMNGKETLDILKRQHNSIPVIMLTGSNDVQDAVDCVKMGAIDFITKPYDGSRLLITIKNVMKIGLLTNELAKLKSISDGVGGFHNLIGHNDGLSHAVQLGRKAAATDIPVLVTGKTGTGKELFARAIHTESKRAQKPMISINCGAIPAQLVESTLFGHEKGSFTGATEKTIGKFREAQGGTIFLDEVGELPLDAQVKLLRTLQQKEVEPVGAGKPVPVDVRIISATNRELEKDVRVGKFREDLFYRLNVFNIELPDLKSRKEDIALLSQSFIEKFCANHNMLPKKLSKEALDYLEEYDWPGNIRELENTINRAMVISAYDTIEIRDLYEFSKDKPIIRLSDIDEQTSFLKLFHKNGTIKLIDDIEQEYIHYALKYYNYNITQAAKAIGMAKSTFYKKIKKQN